MAQQTINIGASPNDGTGTPLRTAFQYTNSNFSELYTAVGPSGNNIVVPGNATITGDLTVDTSTLVVNSSQDRVAIGFSGNASSGRLQINQPLGSTIDGALRITDNATTSFVFNNVSSGVSGIWSSGAIAFGVGSGTFTEAMRLNSTGLGVGTSPTGKLTIGTGVYAAGTLSGTSNLYSTVGQGLVVLTDGFVVGTRTGGDRFILDTSGNVGIGVVPSAGGGCLQLKSGITFPATQVASADANTLDDYEEGTFTPIIGGTATYTTQIGRYVKIGNRVWVTIRLVVNVAGTGDDYRISGLPFVVASSISPVSVGYFGSLKISVNYISGYANTGTSTITTTATTAASASIINGAGVIGNGTDLAISCFYEV